MSEEQSRAKRLKTSGPEATDTPEEQRVMVKLEEATVAKVQKAIKESARGEKVVIRGEQTSHEVTLLTHPFLCCSVRRLFNDAFLKKVKEELLSEKFVKKSNDLYDFQQSRDLNSSEKKHLKLLREAIYSAGFVEIMEQMTGLTLSRKFDMSGHRYSDKSNLLCHDDELEGRKIAYILYLVPENWSKEDGGTLDLYDVDENGQPRDIKESLQPVWNTFSFFEVTPTSFHQVSEIFSADKERVSISGWFHGPDKIVRPPPFKESFHAPKPLSTGSSDPDWSLWINPVYLQAAAQEQVKETFLDQSSIELKGFLKPEVYDALVTEIVETLQSHGKVAGPANRRQYLRLPPETQTTGILGTLLEAFRSTGFATFLQSITGMRTSHYYEEVRGFSKSHYTLIHDHSLEPVGVDVLLFCPKEDWKAEWGGHLVYMDEDEELLTVHPSRNSLLIVFRDEGAMRFVKYVNHYAQASCPEISFVYLPDENEQ